MTSYPNRDILRQAEIARVQFLRARTARLLRTIASVFAIKGQPKAA